MNKLLKRLECILMIPFLPLLIFINIVVGDHVTGIKTSNLNKCKEIGRFWLYEWKCEEKGNE